MTHEESKAALNPAAISTCEDTDQAQPTAAEIAPLLAIAQGLQAAYWDALRSLEEAFPNDVEIDSTDDLSEFDAESFLEEYGEEDEDTLCECGRAKYDCATADGKEQHGDRHAEYI